MKIAIIGAMEQEVSLLRSRIQNLTSESHGGFEYSLGQIDGKEIILLKSGIGKVNAAIGTALLIKLYEPNYIINTGSAGGFHADLEVGDIVISQAVCHHDVDVTPFGYELGQVPGSPACFLPDPNLVEIAKNSIENLGEVAHMHGLIATGDRFMHHPDDVEKTRAAFPDMIACEMEAAAIAQTCHAFEVPFVIIRSLSDIAGKENAVTFEQYLDKAATHSAKLILEMLKEIH
ncbi:5'-methylthioadenosine/S-adenosylhomocysteine nucleosidase [Hydrogenovibrio marinus]|uniref:5'-methylthioadenosine/S-adenosylhomocysteine nucleosidase n=1 Tax=Hydrogenovibrio marinus TaxID=28885 RepID=A0A067A021_HYDMR|nr:5'-methylthioadenosine/S-adenosylhomocysteine nucleosidase [Hydrogenovibrio marinus]KDN95966.1 5'-methylthioadenosine nucleosidase [Hydrogenovibrio marinus]BBN58541.1 5'-methylthioadenosine/S-adenosylhomocysteine nucleosidase [Hydrogenovibrio marinus]